MENLRQLTTGHIRNQIEQLLRLPLLPAEVITEVFQHLREKADEKLDALFQYINFTWITSTQWCPTSWSVYGMMIRTNNDAEGQHHKWNAEVKGKSSFYALTDQLERIALNISFQADLVKHGKYKRDRRANSLEKDKTLCDLWHRYEDKKLTPLELLNELVANIRLHVSTAAEDLADNLDYDRFMFEQCNS